MYNFEKIKLIIWDLDETFWNGVLSEGEIVIPKDNISLIRRLNDIGIMNSICSKNDYQNVKSRLEQAKLWDQFVFVSINWEAKGNRIKQLISDMQLRDENVLFVDDNPSNLNEAKYYCNKLMTAGPEEITNLLKEANKATKSDLGHVRLQQYKVLETKQKEKNTYSSNEEFLYSSGITVDMGKDCLKHIDRIHDLVMRSNQLNFTKIRSSKEELEELFKDDSYQCGYVSVKDRFGGYGIVGFYVIENNDRLLHFCFSCRTLGMGIEQYVYGKLGRPKLTINGEVISSLENEKIPGWINNQKHISSADKFEIQDLKKHMVLFKGPCDLFQIYPYIANTELFDTEFTYTTGRGFTIESTGHTTHVVEAGRLTKEEKQRILKEVPFSDIGMYSDKIYTKPYKVVFISILTDANLGVYRRKETGERIAALEYLHPITSHENWPKLISKEYNVAGINFTEEMLRDFSEKYEFIGRNTPERVVENLHYIREHLSKDCTLVIMLGGELYYEKNSFPAYNDRHLVHKEMNKAVRKFAENAENVRVLDVNKYLTGQDSFYDHFNHYIKPVYYQLASEVVKIVNECTSEHITQTSKLKMVQIRLKEIAAPTYYKMRNIVHGKQRKNQRKADQS